ncbi:MAG: SusD/RagB family nutrient-binding outer membrane lipoprotein [Bacteroidales bacterium]|nr:SusD/RagB family nutrient-binding outer membrane lipoprotein [Bacteroidales bacterium]
MATIIKKIFGLFAAVLLLLTGCTNDMLDEINTDPNNPTDVSVELLLPHSTMSMVNLAVASKQAQWLSTYVEHTANVRLNIMHPADNVGTYWNDNYLNLNNLSIIIDKASAENKWFHVGIAKIIRAIVLAQLTDLYGEIPYKEALEGSNNRAPKFDTQESIYTELQNILDEAIADLSKTSISSPGKYDLLLEGNKDLWVKTAWALKARYYNRLSNIDSQSSATNTLNALSNAFESPSENLVFNGYMTGNVNINPYVAIEKREQAFAASQTIMEVLNGFNDEGYADPRAERWFRKIGDEIIGAPSGVNNPDQSHAIYSGISMENVLNEDAVLPIVTFVEMKFIEAEANLRLGKTAEAYDAYQVAVQQACLASGLKEAQVNEYTAQGTVFPGFSQLSLNDIIEQKYIYFWIFQPVEAFNDYRRTGIPELQNPYGVIKRFPYPADELERNPNSPTNIDEQTIYTIKVWWAKN